MQILETVLREDIKYPDLYNLLGLITMEQKSYIPALNHFRQAIKLNPNYKEAFYNLISAIQKRLDLLKMENKLEEVQKNLDFLGMVLERIIKIGTEEDQLLVSQVQQALAAKNYGKIQSLIYDYRNKLFFNTLTPENIGYEFYLWLRYLPDRLDYDTLRYFDEKISGTLSANPNFPDMWNYLALIHLMLPAKYSYEFLMYPQARENPAVLNPALTAPCEYYV